MPRACLPTAFINIFFSCLLFEQTRDYCPPIFPEKNCFSQAKRSSSVVPAGIGFVPLPPRPTVFVGEGIVRVGVAVRDISPVDDVEIGLGDRSMLDEDEIAVPRDAEASVEVGEGAAVDKVGIKIEDEEYMTVEVGAGVGLSMLMLRDTAEVSMTGPEEAVAGVDDVIRVVGMEGAADEDMDGVVAGRGITDMVESMMTTSVDEDEESEDEDDEEDGG